MKCVNCITKECERGYSPYCKDCVERRSKSMKHRESKDGR